MGDFIGTKAMAEIWDRKPSQIKQWCRDGKIPGAEQDRKGSPWRLPVDALKPEKTKKENKNGRKSFNQKRTIQCKKGI